MCVCVCVCVCVCMCVCVPTKLQWFAQPNLNFFVPFSNPYLFENTIWKFTMCLLF